VKIWVDADSCPVQVREIVIRAGEREKRPVVFVANRKIPFRKSVYASMVVVEKGPGVADEYICDHVEPDDMVITRDIPLAARLLDTDVVVINDRGERFTPNEIREKLSLRDLMQEMRLSGLMPEGQKGFGPREVQAFANCFDRELRRILSKEER
jgi:hypothetical protein